MPKRMVEITAERYAELVANEDWVDALDAAGVNNWEGYDEARQIYRDMTHVGDEA